MRGMRRMESTRLLKVLLAAATAGAPAAAFGQQDAASAARAAQANVPVDLEALAADDVTPLPVSEPALPSGPAPAADDAAAVDSSIPLIDLTQSPDESTWAGATDAVPPAGSVIDPGRVAEAPHASGPIGSTQSAVVIPRARSASTGTATVESPAVAIPHGEQRTRTAGPAPWYRGPYVALAAVLALIAGLTVLFRKFVPTSRPLAADALRVVGRAPLSAKQSAVLLHVGRRIVLVGMSADGVRTLAEITDPEEVAFLLGQTNAAQSAAPAGFDTALSRELEQYTATEDGPADSAARADDALEETQGQLQGLLSRLRAMQSA